MTRPMAPAAMSTTPITLARFMRCSPGALKSPDDAPAVSAARLIGGHDTHRNPPHGHTASGTTTTCPSGASGTSSATAATAAALPLCAPGAPTRGAARARARNANGVGYRLQDELAAPVSPLL